MTYSYAAQTGILTSCTAWYRQRDCSSKHRWECTIFFFGLVKKEIHLTLAYKEDHYGTEGESETDGDDESGNRR